MSDVSQDANGLEASLIQVWKTQILRPEETGMLAVEYADERNVTLCSCVKTT